LVFNSIEELELEMLNMTQRICFIIENNDVDIKEIFQEINFSICQATGVYFRITDTAKNHIYSKCRYSNILQKRPIETRRRNNFGGEKFNCDGILNFHQNESCISILFFHGLNHKFYLEKT
jgi:hypothetical protein